MYLDKFGMEYKRVKKEIMGTYTFQGVPLLEIVDLEKVAEAHKSEIRGTIHSYKGPPLMDLGPREGITSQISQMSGIGGYLVTRAASGPHISPNITLAIVGIFVSMVTRLVLSSQSRKIGLVDFQKWLKTFDKLGDPYKHLANFKQVLGAEQVKDWHTQYQGYGLTL